MCMSECASVRVAPVLSESASAAALEGGGETAIFNCLDSGTIHLTLLRPVLLPERGGSLSLLCALALLSLRPTEVDRGRLCFVFRRDQNVRSMTVRRTKKVCVDYIKRAVRKCVVVMRQKLTINKKVLANSYR